MHKRFLLIILFLSLLKELVWTSLVPIWHFPDEQSHFGQLAYLAERGESPVGDKNDLTEEIRKSEQLLGTERDTLGINKFTYHPEYKIEYTDSYKGKHEDQIVKLAIDKTSRNMVKQESSRYPSFYYALLANIYRKMYSEDLFTRVFTIRIVQLIFFLGTVYFSYAIGKLLFQDEFLGLSLSILVSFHPMFSFVSGGINSDNIGNFIFTFYTFIALRLLKGIFLFSHIVLLFLISFLTLYFKLQFIITLPLSIFLASYLILRIKTTLVKRQTYFTVFIVVTIILVYVILINNIGPSAVLPRFFAAFDLFRFSSYLKTYVFPHLYREVLPWYWGVYDWLGVTYPRYVHRLINWTIVASLLGLAIWLKRNLKSFLNWPKVGIVFLIIESSALVFGIYIYDWLEFSQRNIHLGVQGRYFFPTVTAHMVLILIGIIYILPAKLKKFKFLIPKILAVAMIVLNIYALYTIAKTYYFVLPINTFIIQASQYKPWFFKGVILGGLWVIYFVSLIIFVIRLLLYPRSKGDRRIPI